MLFGCQRIEIILVSKRKALSWVSLMTQLFFATFEIHLLHFLFLIFFLEICESIQFFRLTIVSINSNSFHSRLDKQINFRMHLDGAEITFHRWLFIIIFQSFKPTILMYFSDAELISNICLFLEHIFDTIR